VKNADGSPASHAFVLLEDLIARHVGTIFPAVRLRGVYVFRVTRNFDLEIDEEEGKISFRRSSRSSAAASAATRFGSRWPANRPPRRSRSS
jgi:polyphosphate kinase